MLLALDIGNSTIVAALFDGERKVATTTVPSTPHRSPDHTREILQSLLQDANATKDEITRVGLSSVVPLLTTQISKSIRETLALEPLVIGSALDLGIRIHYDDPATLGSDRICSAIASFARHGGPLIVIDFGTTTTFGVVGINGDFLGGLISFGVRSAAEALHARTAQLPNFDLHAPRKVIATNTPDAMNAGTIFSSIDGVEGIVHRILQEMGVQARVIATGGLSSFMAEHTGIFDAVEPDLVVQGVRLISDRQ